MKVTRMKKYSHVLTLSIAVLAGCQAYPAGLAPQLTTAIPGLPTAARALEARVAFPAARGLLATEADIKALATVSLMAMDGSTLASGVTDGNGAVILAIGQDVNLVAGTCYVLEAVKGLASNAPGKDAVRLRTIVRWTAEGWTSLTSATAGAAATIDKLTTAVAVTVNLEELDATGLMGLVDAAAGTFTRAVTFGDSTDAEVLALAQSVGAYVAGNLDPVATANGLVPRLWGMSAGNGEVGSILTLTGTGFNPLPGQTTVTIGDQSATVIAATPTTIYCVVPNLAPGAHIVKIGGVNASSFIVNAVGPTLTGASLTFLTEGATLTLTGTGFDTTPAANKVMFGSVAATPSAATTTSLTVTVPAGFGNDVQVLVPGAKTNTLTVPSFTAIDLAIGTANRASGGAWATNSLTRLLTGVPNGGTGVEGVKNLTWSQSLPDSANYASLTLATGIIISRNGGTSTLNIQGDLKLGAGSVISANGSNISGNPGGAGGAINLNIAGNLIMEANSAITANGGTSDTHTGGNGGAITIYANGFSLDDTAKIEARGGTGATANGSDGTIVLRSGFGASPSGVFPTPDFQIIPPSTTAQDAISTAYDIGGASHPALTYVGFTKTETKPAGTGITYQFADSADATSWGGWTSDITTLSRRYIRFKATMTTDDAAVTPSLTGLSVQYRHP